MEVRASFVDRPHFLLMNDQSRIRMAVKEASDIKVWAVIIGVADYSHMPALKYTDDDAYRMYAFLKSPEGGALKDEQIKILIDENATKEKINKNIVKDLLIIVIFFKNKIL